MCSNKCSHANDFDCDDGGMGSEYSACPFGTDCADCGPRETATASSQSPSPTPPPPINLLEGQESALTTNGSDTAIPLLGASVAGAFLAGIFCACGCGKIKKRREGKLALQMRATGQPTSIMAARPKATLTDVKVVDSKESAVLKGASEARIVAAAAMAATATMAETEAQAETQSHGQLSDQEAQRQEVASRNWLLGQNTAMAAPVEEMEVAGAGEQPDVMARASEPEEPPRVVKPQSVASDVGAGPVSPNADSLQRARLAAAARQQEAADAQAASSAHDGMSKWLAEAERVNEDPSGEVSEVLRT